MKKYTLPTDYDKLSQEQRREVREQYIEEQHKKCMYCGYDLFAQPALRVANMDINLELFPEGFLDYPIHLQHNHYTGWTEGAVHARCNAVMWQYENR